MYKSNQNEIAKLYMFSSNAQYEIILKELIHTFDIRNILLHRKSKHSC